VSYQVIARKWRPQDFSQLVGQDHISVTLTNALKNNRVPQAILFTGPRGTGKTSSARIFAKALRCPNAVDFVPCNQCSDCLEISQGRSSDVLEIDGASNNGVDSIRELRENVVYSPSSGKYKIYIIDEVHMLSTSAFNALLKTLEEPPSHVIFIMATTDVHKVPQTILSRCQRFDFRRISTRVILERLQEICTQENIEADSDALWMISLQGDGSMRDSQSLLDQVISFANGRLTLAEVAKILGLTDRALIHEALEAIFKRSPSSALTVLSKLNEAGAEAEHFIEDLLECLRHVLVLKIEHENNETSSETSPLVELSDSEVRFLRGLGVNSSPEELHLLFDLCLKSAQDVSRSDNPKLVLEMSLMRLSCAPRLVDLQSLLQGHSMSRPRGNSGGGGGQRQESPKAPASKASGSPKSASLTAKPRSPSERWYDFVQDVKGKDSLLAAKIEVLIFAGEVQKTLKLQVPVKEAFIKTQMEDKETRAKLQAMLDQFWGTGFNLDIQPEPPRTVNANPGVAANPTVKSTATSVKEMDLQKTNEQQKKLAEQVASHSKIKAAHAIFNTQIKEIKEIP
jgi:DNA polymerase-3 subunit gamma/tau